MEPLNARSLGAVSRTELNMDFDHTHEWDEIDEMYRVGPNPSRSVEPRPREKTWGGAETGSVIESSGLHLSRQAPTGA